ncbi:hypothetical protein SYNPS1DRAFT_28827 [Syncephalis pseudoplumigaleata]|uniref:C3H1-type domain-containing protein n=1 Tax=Syncephalis pseudoplumigaleata TaxID=1712513 RepID=A0A4P9Z0N5_9FUNG|nr:hypothetical protein SYNPS1DRAFT_28827 [Syncephalis pseudoplumigaleata]|eukprot:RKP25442.1 hypothetical protein SYNPS1DRAFT_28827 [Syncephalis pseudoplumigaleata]
MSASTVSSKPARRFVRLARNIKARPAETAATEPTAAKNDEPVVESSQAANTEQIAPIPNDMLYILQELNSPVATVEQPQPQQQQQPDVPAPASPVKTRRSARLKKIEAKNEADTAAVPDDMLYIMSAMNGDVAATDIGSKGGKKDGKRQKGSAAHVDGEDTSEDKKGAAKTGKRKKGGGAKEGRAASKRPAWMDRDQQAVDALEQLTQPASTDNAEDKDFNALLMEHMSIVDSTEARCPWSHDLPGAATTSTEDSAAAAPDPPVKKSVEFCRFFKSGSCGKGLWCNFSHNILCGALYTASWSLSHGVLVYIFNCVNGVWLLG